MKSFNTVASNNNIFQNNPQVSQSSFNPQPSTGGFPGFQMNNAQTQSSFNNINQQQQGFQSQGGFQPQAQSQPTNTFSWMQPQQNTNQPNQGQSAMFKPRK